jgi:uncharacterized iron-regulated membrane protein
MGETFRQSMNWLHTWSGVVLGSVLFAIFWMGTLAVFDKEIDLWMAPMTRVALPAGSISLDAQRATYQEAVTARAPTWNIFLPSDRVPMVRTFWFGGTGVAVRYSDPANGANLPDPGTLAGSGFLYPFHYTLNIRFLNLGLWLVGLASMGMLALCVSGVIIHRKIFVDFFTFRPHRKTQRAVLDLHNVFGVLGLPFHIAITLSGVIIFFMLYFPSGWMSVYGGQNLRTFTQEIYRSFSRPRLNKPGGLASLDAMADIVRRLWPDQQLASLTVYYPGDAAAYVQINMSNSDRVTNSSNSAYFDGATGTLVGVQSGLLPTMTAFRFIFGMHVIQFDHWALRWLYFVLGLVGCGLIGTGFLFWLESRRKRHANLRLAGVRIVEAIATASVTGIIIATLAFFVANRALPLGVVNRAGLEVWMFYAVWIASLVHACARPGRSAWREQCWIMSALAVLAVLLNAATTDDNLLRSLAHRYLWPVAGMDLVLLAGAAVAAFAALKLGVVSDTAIPSSSTGEERVENA